jgi:hypothetical protein
LERQAGEGSVNRVRKYYPEEGENGFLNDAAYQVYEPDGRCS